MEGYIEQRKPNKNEQILQLLSEVSEDFNATREVSVRNTGFGKFTIDRNIMSSVALGLSSPALREMVTTLNPNEVLRKVQVVIDNDLNAGDALLAQARVIVSAYLLNKESTEINLNRFTDAVLKLAEIKQI